MTVDDEFGRMYIEEVMVYFKSFVWRYWGKTQRFQSG